MIDGCNRCCRCPSRTASWEGNATLKDKVHGHKTSTGLKAVEPFLQTERGFISGSPVELSCLSLTPVCIGKSNTRVCQISVHLWAAYLHAILTKPRSGLLVGAGGRWFLHTASTYGEGFRSAPSFVELPFTAHFGSCDGA